MTWGEFIKTIASSKINNDSQPKILIELFKRAGSIVDVTKDSANKWIDGTRNCKVNTYFPQGEISGGREVFTYFRNRSATSLKSLRNAFRLINDDKIVKCDAADDNVFCWSLLNQFVELLGFPLLDQPLWEVTVPIEQSLEINKISKLNLSKQTKENVPFNVNENGNVLPNKDKAISKTEPESTTYNDVSNVQYTSGRVTAEAVNIPPTIILRRYLPTIHKKFFGRKNDLKKIEEIFRSNNYAILTGMGGIGKSCIALAYARSLKENGGYVIQHIICDDSDSLRNAVGQLQFDGLKNNENEALTFDDRIDLLKKCGRCTLIVLDNLNRRFEESDRNDFKRLIRCSEHIKVLITSRDTKVLGDNKHNFIKINPIDDIDTLLDLYAYYRFEEPENHINYITEHRKLLEDMFEMVYRHTLTIELLARLAANSPMNEKTIYSKFQGEIDISPVKITIVKDDDIHEGKISELIIKLFNISELNEIKKVIMNHMTLVPYSGIKLRLFKELAGLDADDEIFWLRDRGWLIIDEESKKISLHPLIAKTILNIDEADAIYETCSAFLIKLCNEIKNPNVDKDILIDIGAIALHIFHSDYFRGGEWGSYQFFHLTPAWEELTLPYMKVQNIESTEEFSDSETDGLYLKLDESGNVICCEPPDLEKEKEYIEQYLRACLKSIKNEPNEG